MLKFAIYQKKPVFLIFELLFGSKNLELFFSFFFFQNMFLSVLQSIFWGRWEERNQATYYSSWTFWQQDKLAQFCQENKCYRKKSRFCLYFFTKLFLLTICEDKMLWKLWSHTLMKVSFYICWIALNGLRKVFIIFRLLLKFSGWLIINRELFCKGANNFIYEHSLDFPQSVIFIWTKKLFFII